MKVNVLGTDYEVLFRKKSEDPKLREFDGYAEFYSKKLIIEEIIPDENTFERHDLYEKKVLRHEIIHAFLFESGLDSSSDFARNEELIDWIALQFPKMLKAFQDTDAL